jgi:hypothetical protein
MREWRKRARIFEPIYVVGYQKKKEKTRQGEEGFEEI